eukprot:3011362-Pyramimonas_sp.AAC.1
MQIMLESCKRSRPHILQTSAKQDQRRGSRSQRPPPEYCVLYYNWQQALIIFCSECGGFTSGRGSPKLL